MTSDAVSDLSYADTLWKSADALRGQVDAAEYKHIVLGLLFLKYISDSFQSRRDELQARTDVSIFGQESNPTTWRLAHMNLRVSNLGGLSSVEEGA
jgi:type I restriction-modification system DNA methylase subunit